MSKKTIVKKKLKHNGRQRYSEPDAKRKSSTSNSSLEKIFEIISENINQAIYVMRSDYSEILYANIASEKLYGVPLRELYEDPFSWSKHIHPDDLKKIQSDMTAQRDLSNQLNFQTQIFRMNHPKQGLIWISSTIYPVRKQTDYLVGISTDITGHMQKQAETVNSKRQLEAIYENFDGAIHIIDMDSNEVLFTNNPGKESLGGYRTLQSFWEAIHGNRDESFESFTNDKLMDSNGNPLMPSICEFYNQEIDKWFEVHVQLIPWTNGNLVRMESIFDISKKKNTEQLLKHNQDVLKKKLNKRNAELEDINAALNVLINKGDEDKKNIEKMLVANFTSKISPFIKILKDSHTNEDQKILLHIIETNLKELIEPFSRKLSGSLDNLTRTEVRIAEMIRCGYSSKDIAKTTHNSIRTISNHRNHIRQKLGIKNKKINLRSFLSSDKFSDKR